MCKPRVSGLKYRITYSRDEIDHSAGHAEHALDTLPFILAARPAFGLKEPRRESVTENGRGQLSGHAAEYVPDGKLL